MDQLFTTRQAAERCNLSPRTLEKLRLTGRGPVYVRLGGAVRYPQADLDAWIAGNRRRSTSDVPTAPPPSPPSPGRRGPRLPGGPSRQLRKGRRSTADGPSLPPPRPRASRRSPQPSGAARSGPVHRRPR
jgi:hypothetical protein